MPQHLKICAGDTLVAQLSTGNKGGTLYKISLEVIELNIELSLPEVDTGVQRQPQHPDEHRADFRDDFTHARRCIAGAHAASKVFLQQLERRSTSGAAEMKPITMLLMTNKFSRGIISASPNGNQTVDVNVRIGGGKCRVPDAFPSDESQLYCDGVETSTSDSQTAHALKILKSIAPILLQELSDRAIRG